MNRVRRYTPNGRAACLPSRRASYLVAGAEQLNTENSSTNAWNLNFSSGNANGNNGKNNSNAVRPVAALGIVPPDFLDGVWAAYADCQRNKSRSKGAVNYADMAATDIPRLAYELWTHRYKPTTSTCFLVKYPKLREVFAANYRDRIVHHWVCMRLNPLFEARFEAQGNVSHNCRKGYGTRSALKSLQDGVRAVSCDYKVKAWAFKGDLQAFFMSIDKRLLLACIIELIEREYHGVDKPKSLFGTDGAKGEPIGNLTTQLFANYFLSFFDEYVLRRIGGLHCHYVRYVDDFVIVSCDRAFLNALVPDLEAFLRERLNLTLHPNKRSLQEVRKGIAFVGAVVKPFRAYLGNRVVGRLTERCYGFSRQLERGEPTAEMLRSLRDTLNSYIGFFGGYRSQRQRRRALQYLPSVFYRYAYFKLDKRGLRVQLRKGYNYNNHKK